MFHQIDPRGVFEVRNACGSPSLLVYFLPNFCEGKGACYTMYC